jgi:DNA-binding HxlR family transcriptional regulator
VVKNLMAELKEATLDNEIIDELVGTKTCNLWEAYRKFANPHIALIATALYDKGPMTLGELRTVTGISTNLLNRNLIEMKKVEITKKIGKKYHLTRYGGILKESLDRVKIELSDVGENGLFRPRQEQGALMEG